MSDNHFAEKSLGQRKPWAVMVYLAGGSDVSEQARESLLRMKQVGSTEKVHVIAQFDSGSEGTFTKRYYLSPYPDAIGVETLLRQACAEMPAMTQPYEASAGSYYCRKIREILTATHRARMDTVHTDELIELLKFFPERFKSFVLDCILNEDVYPYRSGNLGYTNAGDPKTLVDFIRWAKIRYPADHTMVVLWGHGSGLSVAWDYPSSPIVDPVDALTAQELQQAFAMEAHDLEKERMEFLEEKAEAAENSVEYMPGIDLIGFNSCSLGTIEVCRQLRDHVHYSIASEGFTPKTSWPYDRILKALDDTPDWSPAEFAGKIVDEYIGYYAKRVRTSEELQKIERKAQRLGASLDMNMGWNQYRWDPALDGKKTTVDLDGKKTTVDLDIKKTNVDLGIQGDSVRGAIDLSVCDLRKSDPVIRTMRHLVDLLQDKLGRRPDMSVFASVLAAHAVSQSYFNKDFTDLGDFCRALQNFSSDKSLQTACRRVLEAVAGLCLKRDSAGSEVANSHGVSIFFPWGEWGEPDVITRYKNLDFIKETRWNLFLRTYRNLIHQFEAGSGAFAAGN